MDFPEWACHSMPCQSMMVRAETWALNWLFCWQNCVRSDSLSAMVCLWKVWKSFKLFSNLENILTLPPKKEGIQNPLSQLEQVHWMEIACEQCSLFLITIWRAETFLCRKKVQCHELIHDRNLLFSQNVACKRPPCFHIWNSRDDKRQTLCCWAFDPLRVQPVCEHCVNPEREEDTHLLQTAAKKMWWPQGHKTRPSKGHNHWVLGTAVTRGNHVKDTRLLSSKRWRHCWLVQRFNLICCDEENWQRGAVWKRHICGFEDLQTSSHLRICGSDFLLWGLLRCWWSGSEQTWDVVITLGGSENKTSNWVFLGFLLPVAALASATEEDVASTKRYDANFRCLVLQAQVASSWGCVTKKGSIESVTLPCLLQRKNQHWTTAKTQQCTCQIHCQLKRCILWQSQNGIAWAVAEERGIKIGSLSWQPWWFQHHWNATFTCWWSSFDQTQEIICNMHHNQGKETVVIRTGQGRSALETLGTLTHQPHGHRCRHCHVISNGREIAPWQWQTHLLWACLVGGANVKLVETRTQTTNVCVMFVSNNFLLSDDHF